MAQIKVTDTMGNPVSGATYIVAVPGAAIIGLGAGNDIGTTRTDGTAAVPQPGALSGGGNGDVHVQKIWSDGTITYGSDSWDVDWLGNWTPDTLTIQLTAPTDATWNALQQTQTQSATNASSGQSGLFGNLDKALTDLVYVAVAIVAIVLFVQLVLPKLMESGAAAKVKAKLGGAKA